MKGDKARKKYREIEREKEINIPQKEDVTCCCIHTVLQEKCNKVVKIHKTK